MIINRDTLGIDIFLPRIYTNTYGNTKYIVILQYANIKQWD